MIKKKTGEKKTKFEKQKQKKKWKTKTIKFKRKTKTDKKWTENSKLVKWKTTN